MCSIADYLLVHNSKIDAEVVKYKEVPLCPDCGTQMSYRDSRKRIRRKKGGVKLWVMVSRFLCSACNRLHTALPDFLIPYKHYEAEIIRKVIDGEVTAETIDAETFSRPAEITLARWIAWFEQDKTDMEGHLRRVSSQLGFGDAEGNRSLLEELRKNSRKWLESAIRIIYNSGGYLRSFRI
jgi:hypothetical protein